MEKDLASIAFPVTFNEPLTLLQRTAEEVEYYHLLDDASQIQDPVERMCYVAAFAVSGYAHTRHRSSRKGLLVLPNFLAWHACSLKLNLATLYLLKHSKFRS